VQIPLSMRFSSYFDHDHRILIIPFLAGWEHRAPSVPSGATFTERFFDALAPVANHVCATPANKWPVNRRGAQQDLDTLSEIVGDEWASSVVFGDSRLMRKDCTIGGKPAPLIAGWYNATLAHIIETYARQNSYVSWFIVNKGLYGYEVGSTTMLSDEPGMLPWFRHFQDVSKILESVPVQISGLRFPVR